MITQPGGVKDQLIVQEELSILTTRMVSFVMSQRLLEERRWVRASPAIPTLLMALLAIGRAAGNSIAAVAIAASTRACHRVAVARVDAAEVSLRCAGIQHHAALIIKVGRPRSPVDDRGRPLRMELGAPGSYPRARHPGMAIIKIRQAVKLPNKHARAGEVLTGPALVEATV